MKKLVLLNMFFFLFSGCEKEELSEQNDLQNLNAAVEFSQKASTKEIMVPLKGEIIEIADLTNGTLDCGIPNYYPPAHYDDISGSLTHLGNVEGGYADLSNCRMRQKDGMPFLLVDASGLFMSANRDTLLYEGQLWFSLTDPSLSTSEFTITGGTGRWENASGYFAGLFEPLEDGTLFFAVDGYVTPPGKNK
ncbi:MAG TPA: hypothetical protein VIN11_07480 [Roseivirga sp.]